QSSSPITAGLGGCRPGQRVGTGGHDRGDRPVHKTAAGVGGADASRGVPATAAPAHFKWQLSCFGSLAFRLGPWEQKQRAGVPPGCTASAARTLGPREEGEKTWAIVRFAFPSSCVSEIP